MALVLRLPVADGGELGQSLLLGLERTGLASAEITLASAFRSTDSVEELERSKVVGDVVEQRATLSP